MSSQHNSTSDFHTGAATGQVSSTINNLARSVNDAYTATQQENGTQDASIITQSSTKSSSLPVLESSIHLHTPVATSTPWLNQVQESIRLQHYYHLSSAQKDPYYDELFVEVKVFNKTKQANTQNENSLQSIDLNKI